MGARKFTESELSDETDAALVAGALRTVVVDPRGRRAKVYSRETGEVVGKTDTSRVVATLVEQQGLIAELRPEVRDELRIRRCVRCGVDFQFDPNRNRSKWCRACNEWAAIVKCPCGAGLSVYQESITRRLKGVGLNCKSCANRIANASRPPERRSQSARKARASLTPQQRSEAAYKANAKRAPEQRASARRKAWATRRAKAAKATEETK